MDPPFLLFSNECSIHFVADGPGVIFTSARTPPNSVTSTVTTAEIEDEGVDTKPVSSPAPIVLELATVDDVLEPQIGTAIRKFIDVFSNCLRCIISFFKSNNQALTVA
ncbi:hypothetical protein E1B28_007794 [Marasmius oreades]|uniref:Uncharacterized protein n=1 Tax=Marasmius oreades TaxID=181124 RepID=A0A9P7UTU6_9AGAR|nr:uncharacterized protein E1B28_007794 [Marasmius oreades]KAG7094187.1 hypothetical protein E1B28_007794 [Marasmius oreades]